MKQLTANSIFTSIQHLMGERRSLSYTKAPRKEEMIQFVCEVSITFIPKLGNKILRKEHTQANLNQKHQRQKKKNKKILDKILHSESYKQVTEHCQELWKGIRTQHERVPVGQRNNNLISTENNSCNGQKRNKQG